MAYKDSLFRVNAGRNSGILEVCGELKGYAFFVFRVQFHEKELAARGEVFHDGERTVKAIRLAIRDCKNANLLRNFWENMSQEEINMLANEWDMKTALEVREEEGFERGVGKGRQEGRKEGRKEGVETTARNALAEGLSREQIHRITGLDMDTIAGLQTL